MEKHNFKSNNNLKSGKRKGFSKRNKSGPDRMFPKTVSLMPKEIKSAPIWQYKRRYIAQANIAGSLMISDLLRSAIVSQTAVLGNSMLRAVRVKKIRIWVPVTTQGTPVSVRLTPTGIDSGINSFSDIPETIYDTSISIDRPAFVSYKPAELHPSGSWHASTAVDLNLVAITCNQGAVMDVDYEAILNFTGPLLGFTQVMVGAVPGGMYCMAAISNFIAQAVNINP